VTAFGRIFGNNISTHASNYTILTTDQGKFFQGTATLTFTLPNVASAGTSFVLAIINTGSGIVTVDGATSETINGSTTIILDPNDAIILTCNGSLWIGSVVRDDLSASEVSALAITRIAGSSGAAGAVTTWQNLTSDFSTASETLVVAMTTTGVGAGTWKFKYTLIYQSNNGGSGIGLAINHTGTAGEFAARWSHVTTGSTAATGVGDDDTAQANGQMMEGKMGNTLDALIGSTSTGVAAVDTDIIAVLEGIIVVTATGSLELKARVQTSATMLLMADSCLELLKIE